MQYSLPVEVVHLDHAAEPPDVISTFSAQCVDNGEG